MGLKTISYDNTINSTRVNKLDKNSWRLRMLYSLRCSFDETNSCLYTHWRAPVHLSVSHTNHQYIYWTNMLLHCGWIEVLYTIAHKRAEGCWNETLNQWNIPPVEISYHLIHVKCILKSKWMRMCTAFWRTPHKGDSLKLPFDGTTPMKTTPVQYSLFPDLWLSL